MVRAVRSALEEVDGPVAVVVGAWHAPALRTPMSKKREAKLLAGLPGGRGRGGVAATWVPWTEPRLAAGFGYGAGVRSPGWYAHLWETRKDADAERSLATWMARCGRLLREEGFTAATSSAIDATRLAGALTATRGQSRPGFEEVMDAALAALCHGEEVRLKLITRRLVIGEAIGEVDPSVPTMPLAEDLARHQRRLRLKPESLERQVALDLRTKAGGEKSRLLHRLVLMGVAWGTLVDGRAGRGTFREVWKLEWDPELSVCLAEALRFGTTLESAAAGAARAAMQEASEARELGTLADLVETCLVCELESEARLALASLQRAAIQAPDLRRVLETLPPLADVVRYGTARSLPAGAIEGLIDALFAQAASGLGAAARGLDAEQAMELGDAIGAVDRTIVSQTGVGENEVQELFDRALWTRTLDGLARDELAAAFVRGIAARRLFDRGDAAEGRIDRWMGRALSSASEPQDAGAWLEGFLGGDAQVLLHEEALLRRFDQWLAGQDDAHFEELLPLLRR
ncbi:MAG: DUF5682 family protein, partial [Planctomycetota bacterium]